ncbi:MAG: hypothetical protein AB1665_06645, partial [Candidatus Thermoplasmatota archaeon]
RWIEFKADGKAVSSDGSTATWKDKGNGKVELTTTVSGQTVTITMDYKVSGNTLTLTFTQEVMGATATMVSTYRRA